jgi:hypothetical protein
MDGPRMLMQETSGRSGERLIHEPGHGTFKIISALYECLIKHRRGNGPTKDTGQNIERRHIALVGHIIGPRIAFDIMKI